MQSAKFGVLAICAALSLSACSTLDSDKIDYKSASKGVGLEVPPDLNQLSRDSRYTVPGGAVTASSFQIGQAAPAVPTAASTLGDVRIERAGTQRWLVVNRSADQLWGPVRDFWQESGFLLTMDEANLGIMETDWAENRAAVPQDFLQRWMSKYVSFLNDTYKRDKFRTRIERGTEPGTIEIFISHRGAAQQPTKTNKGRDEDWVWQPAPADTNLEAEFLSRMMVAFGTPEQKASQAVAQLNQGPERAFIEKGKDGGTQLVVDDAFDRAWRRVGLALDRTGFTVVDRDRSKGLYFVRYANPDLDVKKDKGWLDKLAFWKSDEPKTEQYRVVVTQADPRSVVTVQDPAGAPDKSVNSDKILALLKDQLK
jgi:outer membrane protein assembly factor BamC